MRRRLAVLVSTVFATLIWPAAAWAATPVSTVTNDKPTGTDYTLTTVFVVALGIPVVLTVLTLIDIAVGRGKHDDH